MEKADISVIVGEHLLNYRVSAIIKKENKVLVHHSIGSEHFTLPGGRVKEGESSIEALQREIKEEMDFETEYVRPVSLIENFFIMKGKEYHELLMTHELKFKNEEIYAKEKYEPVEPEKQGKLEFLWIDIKDIDNINFVPEAMKNVIKENIILQQQSLMHQANRTSVTHTRSCWQMPSQDIKEVRDTMYSSRQEQTNMDRRLS